VRHRVEDDDRGPQLVERLVLGARIGVRQEDALSVLECAGDPRSPRRHDTQIGVPHIAPREPVRVRAGPAQRAAVAELHPADVHAGLLQAPQIAGVEVAPGDGHEAGRHVLRGGGAPVAGRAAENT